MAQTTASFKITNKTGGVLNRVGVLDRQRWNWVPDKIIANNAQSHLAQIRVGGDQAVVVTYNLVVGGEPVDFTINYPGPGGEGAISWVQGAQPPTFQIVAAVVPLEVNTYVHFEFLNLGAVQALGHAVAQARRALERVEEVRAAARDAAGAVNMASRHMGITGPQAMVAADREARKKAAELAGKDENEPSVERALLVVVKSVQNDPAEAPEALAAEEPQAIAMAAERLGEVVYRAIQRALGTVEITGSRNHSVALKDAVNVAKAVAVQAGIRAARVILEAGEGEAAAKEAASWVAELAMRRGCELARDGNYLDLDNLARAALQQYLASEPLNAAKEAWVAVAEIIARAGGATEGGVRQAKDAAAAEWDQANA